MNADSRMDMLDSLYRIERRLKAMKGPGEGEKKQSGKANSLKETALLGPISILPLQP